MVARTFAEKYPVVDAAFGARVNDKMLRARLNNAEVGRRIGVTAEVVRRYREGRAVPRERNLAKLATLLGMTPSELRYGPKGKEAGKMPLKRLDPDEEAMLDEYRQLAPDLRRLARARIVELLEEFTPPSKKNPFGKGTQ